MATTVLEPTSTATNMATTPARSTAYGSDETRWQAVLERDAKADGRFFTCVHTTGIYCRPTCPARKPKRENVSFVATRADALRAGFRPCKRCTPDDETTFPERQAGLIAKACGLIERSEERITLDQLAARFGMSRFHFHRIFKEITGVTPKAYADAHRADRVRTHLGESGSVTQAIYGAGYASNGRFYATSAKVLGMTPTDYRTGGMGMTIQVTIEPSSLGNVLVATTDQGICSIMLGDDSTALLDDLLRRFPKAEIVASGDAFAEVVAEVIGVIEEPARSFQLPLDIRGTAFQQRVWQALRDVPAGETASYSDIAERIGSPKAVRAVAQACKHNHIAVVIPCHRIIGKDGSLTGYNWGTERKKVLLEREREATLSAD